MTPLDVIKDFWALIVSAIALIVWLVRLEAKSNKNADDNKRNDTEIQRLRDNTDAMLREIRHDIKTILSRGN